MDKIFQVDLVQKTFVHDSTTGPSIQVNMPTQVTGPAGPAGAAGPAGDITPALQQLLADTTAAKIAAEVARDQLTIFYRALESRLTKLDGGYPLRIAVTNQRAADLSRTTTATNNRCQQRSLHLLGGPVSEIRLGFSPYVQTTGAEASIGLSYTVDQAALEVEGVGTYPATFAGSRTRIIAPTEVIVWSDPLVVPTAVLGQLNRDTRLWARAQFTATNNRLPINTCYLIGSGAMAGSSSYLFPADGTATPQTTEVLNQIDAQGALIQPAGNQTSGVNNNMRTGQSSNTGHTVPVYIAARFTDPTVRSVIVIGDSNSAGVGDPNVSPAYASSGTIAGRGVMSRMSVNTTEPWQAIPTLNCGFSGQYASSWNTAPFRKEMMKYADIAIDGEGNNDAVRGDTQEAILANRRLIWADAKAQGCKVIAMTIPPRTASTTNNTPFNAAFAAGGTAQLHNQALAGEMTAGRINSVFNVRQYVSDPANETIWLSPASTYARSDGTHFAAGSTSLLAPPLRWLVQTI